MGTLLEDIKVQSGFIIKAFSADDLKLDYTVHSFIEVDKFFNRNVDNGRPVKGGQLNDELNLLMQVKIFARQEAIRFIDLRSRANNLMALIKKEYSLE